jgi:hypothetical protein
MKKQNTGIVNVPFDAIASTDNFINKAKPGTLYHKKILESPTLISTQIYSSNVKVLKTTVYYSYESAGRFSVCSKSVGK